MNKGAVAYDTDQDIHDGLQRALEDVVDPRKHAGIVKEVLRIVFLGTKKNPVDLLTCQTHGSCPTMSYSN